MRPIVTSELATDQDRQLSVLYGRLDKLSADYRAACRAVKQEIAEILGSPATSNDLECVCLRCDYRWHRRWLNRMPRCCPRCHSASWSEAAVSERARRPDDLPNPRWRRPRVRTSETLARVLASPPPAEERVAPDSLPPPPSPSDVPAPFSQPLSAELARLRSGGATEPAPESIVGRSPSNPESVPSDEKENP